MNEQGFLTIVMMQRKTRIAALNIEFNHTFNREFNHTLNNPAHANPAYIAAQPNAARIWRNEDAP